MKRTTPVIVIVMILGCLGHGTAFSADSGRFYAGVGGGRSSVDGPAQAESIPILPALVLTVPSSVSINGFPLHDHHTAWTAFAGYAATRYVGVEGGFWDHGTFGNDRLTGAGLRLRIREWYFGATLTYPVFDRFSLNAGAGLSRGQFEARGNALVLLPSSLFPGSGSTPVRGPGLPFDSAGLVSVPFSSPKDRTGGYWDVGASARLPGSTVARLSYGRHDVGVAEIKSIGLTLRYEF